MSEQKFAYDVSSPKSIENHAKKLENKSFREALDGLVIREKGNKGGLGQLLEKSHFGYEINSNAEPDFEEAGVELKTTPYIYRSKNRPVAKERLVLNIIDYMTLPHEKFENSSFWKKNQTLLLIFYLHQAKDVIPNRLDYQITHAQLFQFPEKDLKIIKADWEKIVEKVRQGKAHELSEGDTNYLGACTKGANKYSHRPQPYSDEYAMQRAFSLKTSYMTTVLNHYILPGKKTYHESILEENDLGEDTLESFILKKFNRFSGMSVDTIMSEVGEEVESKPKHFTARVASKMLNLDDRLEKTEEFRKANIKVKNITVSKKGKVKESMSFPAFKYKELIKEEWDSSTLREMFLNTRFLFVVFRYNEHNELFFEKALFWNIPHNDLEIEVREVWDETINRIKDGECRNLPTASENPVAHVRPHAQNKQDTYETPQGDHVVKKSFWLNNKYIEQQIGL
ncbi:restriction endonuclease [Pontibacillus yanchengensis]|uniref:Restriction endonuclease n=2 Tax=Pontibacillus yanchengensis TaxID=462910 RepID=A0ACC7VDA2_9BACI|nr:Sau3AI family type II restriction endonuclease [Pontibacillus yanchengensis]MYL32075.1 restriction endonuclease [Pontibacillus yanchengensis]MYL52655.1 restriction endonuclease [Pontibacillus yanchengensis]